MSVNFSASRTEHEILSSQNLKAFTYSELSTATRNFDFDCLIGEGGSGYVYKGWIDVQQESRMVIAVKKLKDGDQSHKEWLAEVDYHSQLHHQNVVRLMGYCMEEEYRLLVYEYMPNGSLANNLFTWSANSRISWERRIKIATDVARGLAFLHSPEQPVIFRDLKPANILLDSEYNAKLSDFGFAIAGPTGDRSHVSTEVLGTFGYVAPEYNRTGHLTTKCDVYSFGVVLIELFTGRRALQIAETAGDTEIDLITWVKDLLRGRAMLSQYIDPRIRGEYKEGVLRKLFHIANECVSDDPKLRPEMVGVLASLTEAAAAGSNQAGDT